MTFFHYTLSKIFIAVPINYFAAFPGVTSPQNLGRRASNSMEPHGNVSFHRLGGRDHGDPLSNVMVTRSDKGWHCPECIHIGKSQCGKIKNFSAISAIYFYLQFLFLNFYFSHYQRKPQISHPQRPSQTQRKVIQMPILRPLILNSSIYASPYQY